jgi:hypothetical protein
VTPGLEQPAPAVPSSAAPLAPRWADLLAAALVGTARRRPPLFGLGLDVPFGPDPDPNRRSSPRHEPGQERQFRPADGGDPAAALLAAAAVLSARSRAGRLPEVGPRRLPEPAAPDERPACSEAAVEVLELILSGEVPIPGGVALLAGQWLDGAARAGCRLPARLLPRLLDLGSANPDLRPSLRIAAGPRGRWLAGHDGRWAWAGGAPFDGGEAAAGGFTTAARVDRPALLEAVRRGDPARARDLLASTWKSDPAAERAALLAVLATGLSDDDEPFLEAALDDRSAAVRRVAADLLSRLPTSRRSARMADRLRPLVSRTASASASTAPVRAALADGGGGAGGFSVARPPQPDAAARRDGIEDAAPAGMGVSAWRIVQLVAGAPLSFWSDHLGLGPAEVVDLVTHEAPEVLAGLEFAVAAQAGRADPAWAQAVFTRRPTPAVLRALPPETAARELAALLGRGFAPRPNIGELYAACPGPWPVALGDAVLDRYRQLGGKAAIEMPAALPVLAARLDPSALPLVETWVVTLAGDQATRRRVQTLGHALSLRVVIQREFP